ncbi:threonine dehydrogenase-like Zn-dependent dehydrogenase [Paraburkholderia atlantica]|uniref:Threonine dehydrogenase-like Zn-dependent dehydrogenase n=1 Tax=Paraburkholderia atlantica TaxID=2654982 RepID=A0A7W8V2K6_PARAM|nr:zinc-binding dehydrogenase [Paraburkholderia atlantica]MBB5420881.1 threonine dehydrogenase-like Zn-dependent dehydrogenase [Paraburkholderia atlantica]MBB5423353.1 threonine dehydrogenase-like Zn-dependent dehydrogenase [Paraburkholderia atlantica]NUY34659.1 alcohol dehydrogenase catalytic domain-containing protein [Paraburkholderia atlantica]
MTKKVLAAVKTDVETTELREFDYPQVRPETGILRIEASGVGGSDPELYRKAGHVPVIMGHENVGTIEEVGEIAAKRWGVKPGDRVALHEYLPCWNCEWCMKGDFRLCMEVDFFNVKDRLNTDRFGMSTANKAPHLWGGYAQYMHMPLNTVMHKIPQDMRATHATLAVPFGNGVQWACLDGGAGPGKVVLVFGPGQQGLGCVLAAKAAGSYTVILAGMTRDQTRLDLSLRLGADYAINVETQDLEAEVMRITKGRGVDVVVDTTGDPKGEIVKQAIALAAKGAYLSLNGLEQHVPIGEIKKRYLTVRAPRGRSYAAVELALRYIGSGRYPIDEVCSHTFGLAQTHEAILATAGRGVEGAIHVCVDPWK